MIHFADGGWYLPEGEAHLQEWMTKVNKRRDGRLLYQSHKYERGLKLCSAPWTGTAIDIGAHVGLWSWQMAKDFERVIAFEPMAEHRECWLRNMEPDVGRWALHSCALGASSGMVRLKCRTPGSTGDTGVDPVAERSSLRASVDVEGEIAHLEKLDSFGFENVAFIKLDCEGYELFALQGARETLLRNRPVVVVEQKPETGMEERYGVKPQDCFDFMAQLGAKHRGAVQGDHFFSFA